jgi:hypothetical protein
LVDLLRSIPALTVAVAITAAATGACSGGDVRGPSDATGPSASSVKVPGAEQDPPTLQPLRPDEVVVDRATGSGDGGVSGVAGELVMVYTVCEHGRSTEVRTDFPHVAPQQVPCDGVVSRAQIYTERGRPFRADIEAPPTTTWQLLVTRRSE